MAADYVAEFREYLVNEKHASDNTLSSYLRDMQQFQTWLVRSGVSTLRKVDRARVEEYL